MRILCSAKLANTTAGHVDHALAYAVGLAQLGHDVMLVDFVGRGRCVEDDGRAVPFEQWSGRAHFEAIARGYGLWPRCCLVNWRHDTYGESFRTLLEFARSADLLLVRSGTLHRLHEVFEAPARRVFLDGNPGSTQTMYAETHPDREPLDRYEFRFTLGLNIGTALSPIPCSGLRWHALPRPVVLPLWPAQPSADGAAYTTISTWKGRATVALEGMTSGEKADNWLDYLSMPVRSGQPMEIALRIQRPADEPDRELFRAQGWQVRDARSLDDFATYRDFIARSRAEFSVAHDRYVAFRTGWFSDRSATYLASGKPVIVQSTGFEAQLPTGLGLLSFASPDEALGCIAAVAANPLRHAHAAREIAEQHFAAAHVLRRLLAIVS